jgi:hypothetical protein
MTGTNCDLFTHKQCRSYLNHLVFVVGLPFKWTSALPSLYSRVSGCLPLFVTQENDYDLGTGFAGASQTFDNFWTVSKSILFKNLLFLRAVVSYELMSEIEFSVLFRMVVELRVNLTRGWTISGKWQRRVFDSICVFFLQASLGDKEPPPELLQPKLYSCLTTSTLFRSVGRASSVSIEFSHPTRSALEPV